MIFLGIDPGLHGGAAALDSAGRCLALAPLPLIAGRLDPVALAAWVRAHVPIPGALAAVEMVGAMPGQGVCSMFTFGEGVGIILGVLGALGLVPVRPRPQTWQGRLCIALPPAPRQKGEKATKEEKAERRAAVKASALAFVVTRWPDAPLIPSGCRVPHDGMVDALCLAEYLRRAQSDCAP